MIDTERLASRVEWGDSVVEVVLRTSPIPLICLNHSLASPWEVLEAELGPSAADLFLERMKGEFSPESIMRTWGNYLPDYSHILVRSLQLIFFCRISLPCRYDLQLDFLEAVFGCSREIDVDRLAACTVGIYYEILCWSWLDMYYIMLVLAGYI